MFSINANESTNANVDRIFNVLLRYYDEDPASGLKKGQFAADTTTLTHTLADILQSN